MRYDRTDPCPHCPFLVTSLPGWLGRYEPDEVMEVCRHDGVFACHPTVDYERPDWEQQIADPRSKVQYCAGALIFMRRLCKLSRDPERARATQRVNKDYPILFPAEKFIEHHTQYQRHRRRHDEDDDEDGD